MSEREEVMREFGVDELVRLLPMPVSESVRTLADEIAALRAQLTTAERERDEARRALAHVRQQAGAWKQEARTQKHTVDGVGEVLGGVPDYGPIVASVEALRHRAERAERVVEAARAWLADLWRGDLNGTVIGVCMEYEPDGQYALWEQVAPIAEAVRALDAAEGSNA